MSNKNGKKLLCRQCLLIFVVLFCATAVVSLPRLANFSPCDPLIFCFSPTLYAHSFLKIEFFRMFMGNFWERNREREIFRLKRFPNIEAKSYFCTVLLSKWNLFLQFPLGLVKRHAEKKKFSCWLKNIEPGERNGRFWTPILMFIFHEKCQTLGHVKMQSLPRNTPLFLVFWPHPEPP